MMPHTLQSMSSNRLIIASMSQQIHQLLSTAEVEAAAAARSLEFALEIGVNQAVLEGDSEMVIQHLLTKLNLKFFPIPIVSLSFSHTKREGSKLAHNLARYFINIKLSG